MDSVYLLTFPLFFYHTFSFIFAGDSVYSSNFRFGFLLFTLVPALHLHVFLLHFCGRYCLFLLSFAVAFICLPFFPHFFYASFCHIFAGGFVYFSLFCCGFCMFTKSPALHLPYFLYQYLGQFLLFLLFLAVDFVCLPAFPPFIYPHFCFIFAGDLVYLS